MINRLNVASIYVLDKDEALDFYVNKLGLEKGNDVRQGDYRWLTIKVPGEASTEVSLEQPGPPLHDEATAAHLRELITKGALGGLVFITDDEYGRLSPDFLKEWDRVKEKASIRCYGISLGCGYSGALEVIADNVRSVRDLISSDPNKIGDLFRTI